MSKTIKGNIPNIPMISTNTTTFFIATAAAAAEAAMSSSNRTTATAAAAAAVMSSNNNNNNSGGSSSSSFYDASAAPSYFYWTNDGGGGAGSDGVANGINSISSRSTIYDNSNSNDVIGFDVALNGSISSSISGSIGSSSSSGSQLFSSSVTMDYNETSLDYAAYMYNQSSERCMSMDTNNTVYWNITCDTPLEYGVPMYGYLMPFLLVITCVANSLIVLVLSKKNMASPTNFVLMGMAICDMLTVIFPAPGLIYMYTFGNHYKPLHPVSMCLSYSIFNEMMPSMCHTASIWLTLALAVQRYIYVCHAPMARTWCTLPRVKRCTLYICIVAFLHQSTRFFDRTYYPLIIDWNGQKTEVCHVETSPWVHNYIGEDFYFTSYYLFRVLFVHLIPCILLVTLNILLFSAMRQAQERRKLLFRENRKKECKKLRESNCTTLMLIVVVTVFLIVEIPIAVVTAMHIVSSLIIQFLDYKIANIFITFTNFFLVVSYPINFGIYCGMSRQFRETFKEIFLGRLIAKKDNSSKYSIVNGPRTCTNTNETVL